jgi:hypothetical protein
MLTRIARPVLEAFAAGEAKARMPVGGRGEREDRRAFTHLEALGRTLVGLAPWLESPRLEPDEARLQEEFRVLARTAVAAATDPASPDFVNFSYEYQPIVDAAFLAHALLRSGHQLRERLEEPVRRNLAECLRATRSRKPFACNWLLFGAMIEAALCQLGEDWDRMRVDYAIRQHEQWYLGDGVYGDGPEFHWDYYNSFVIQPMLVDLLAALGPEYPDWAALQPAVDRRAVRYAAILERLIAPDGSFPPVGRSLAYRSGAFQLLAQLALQQNLPPELQPAQVRSALTAVIRRTLEAPGTFDDAGWLRIGLCGDQNGLGEPYISTGSLYLCTTAFLPLGLAPDDPFWADAPRDWTAKRIWSGLDSPCDHALAE